MLQQPLAQGLRRPLIDQDAHLRRSYRAACRVFKDGTNLFDCDAGEPFDELVRRRVVLEVLEKGGDGYARAAEHHAPL